MIGTERSSLKESKTPKNEIESVLLNKKRNYESSK